MTTSKIHVRALALLRNAHDPKKLEIAVMNIAQGEPHTVWRRELIAALLESLHIVGTTPQYSEIINNLEKEPKK